MEQHKTEFIKALVEQGVMLIGDYDLVTGRSCPYYLDTGKFDDGRGLRIVGDAFAARIAQTLDSLDNCVLYGIPEKGISLMLATATALERNGVNVPWFYTREGGKKHGEQTGTDAQQPRVVGRKASAQQRIISLDNVLSSGTSALESRTELEKLELRNHTLLALAVDRQEVLPDGTNAIEAFERETGTPVVSVISMSDVLEYLRARDAPHRNVQRIENYLRVYGTMEAQRHISPLQQHLFIQPRSIMPSLDTNNLDVAEEIVQQTCKMSGIGGYKLGVMLALAYGLPRVVETLRKHTEKPIIYNHEKAGTDTPHTARGFAATCKASGIDAVILYPQAGPETQRAWTYHALDEGLVVLVGGWMTHPAYVTSEGGYIADAAAIQTYRNAARMGISTFVVPGTKPDAMRQILDAVRAEGIEATIFAPGFVRQGGNIASTVALTGGSLHAFVGRAFTERADRDYQAVAKQLVAQLHQEK